MIPTLRRVLVVQLSAKPELSNVYKYLYSLSIIGYIGYFLYGRCLVPGKV